MYASDSVAQAASATVGVQEAADVERERRRLGRLAVTVQRLSVEPDGGRHPVDQVPVLAGALLEHLGVRSGVHAEPVGDRGGPVDRVGVVSAEHDRWSARLVRQRADDEAVTPVVATVDVDGRSGPRLPADLDQLDRAPDPLAAMPTEALELDVAVAEAESDCESSAGQGVEEGGVFGEADRIVQRCEGEPEPDRDPRGRLHHRARVRRDRADEPCLVEVMLADPHAVEPDRPRRGPPDRSTRATSRRGRGPVPSCHSPENTPTSNLHHRHIVDARRACRTNDRSLRSGAMAAFEPAVYADRRRVLGERMVEHGVDLLFCPPSGDLEYLTGARRRFPTFGNISYTHGWVCGAFFRPGQDPVFVLPRMVAEFDMPTGVPGRLRRRQRDRRRRRALRPGRRRASARSARWRSSSAPGPRRCSP